MTSQVYVSVFLPKKEIKMCPNVKDVHFAILIVFNVQSILRAEVNMDSGCRASAVHIVAFGVLMGFRRSPLKLCL